MIFLFIKIQFPFNERRMETAYTPLSQGRWAAPYLIYKVRSPLLINFYLPERMNIQAILIKIKYFSPNCLFREVVLVAARVHTLSTDSELIKISAFEYFLYRYYVFMFMLIKSGKIIFPNYFYPKLEQFAAWVILGSSSLIVHQTSDRIVVKTTIKQQLGTEE